MSNVPMFKCSNIPIFHAQKFKCSNVQMLKRSNFQMSNVNRVKLLFERTSGVPPVISILEILSVRCN